MKEPLQQRLRGVGVALSTPFQSDFSIDFEAFAKLVKHTGEHVDYFVVNGTTAESPALAEAEVNDLLACVHEHNAKGLPIVLGHGGNHTHSLVRKLERLDLSGVAALLSVAPYYNAPNQDGLKRHYQALADASALPIILYNVPKRTGANLTGQTTAELSSHPNIIAIKEAAGNIRQCLAIRQQAKSDFMLLSGDDLMTLPMIALGCSGVISVMANALPKHFCQMVHLALDGKAAEAERILLSLLEINDLLYEEGNPTGVKQALEILGIGHARTRLPLAEASGQLRHKIEIALQKLT